MDIKPRRGENDVLYLSFRSLASSKCGLKNEGYLLAHGERRCPACSLSLYISYLSVNQGKAIH